MPKRHLDREDRLAQHCRRLNTWNPVCVSCPESDPVALELHHIAQRGHHDDVVIVCANCHRKLSDQQRDHEAGCTLAGPTGPSGTGGQMETIGHYLLGLADLFAMLVETLRKFGTWLVSEANREGH